MISGFVARYRAFPPRTKAALLTVVLAAAFLIGAPVLNEARLRGKPTAELYWLQPQRGAVSPGRAFPLELRLKTGGQAVNAVSAHIAFNPAYLEVLSMTTEKSFCTYYLDNAFDTMRGTVTVSCGVPQPGFLGDSVVARVNFRPKTAGTTELTLGPGTQAAANDGKGSDILKNRPSFRIPIVQQF